MTFVYHYELYNLRLYLYVYLPLYNINENTLTICNYLINVYVQYNIF